ncbi:MAG: hypothetical protein ACYC42_05515, partial [Lysobacter sp.]
SLEQQSEQLVQTVAVFRLEAGRDGRDGRVAAPAPAPRRSSVVAMPPAARKPAPAKPAAKRAAAPPRKAVATGASEQSWQEF